MNLCAVFETDEVFFDKILNSMIILPGLDQIFLLYQIHHYNISFPLLYFIFTGETLPHHDR